MDVRLIPLDCHTISHTDTDDFLTILPYIWHTIFSTHFPHLKLIFRHNTKAFSICKPLLAAFHPSRTSNAALTLPRGYGGLSWDIEGDFRYLRCLGYTPGALCLVMSGMCRLCALQGRVHYYEGYSMTEAVRPYGSMKILGQKFCF